MEGRLIEKERSQQRPLHGSKEAARSSARVSEQVRTVARGGKDGRQVFDLAFEGVM